MAIIDVTIQKDGAGGCVTVASSGGANPTLTQGTDDIRSINKTGAKVILFFPHDAILGDDAPFHQVIRKDKNYLHAGPDGGTVGGLTKFKYSIYCLATTSFAHGSDLEIIVQ